MRGRRTRRGEFSGPGAGKGAFQNEQDNDLLVAKTKKMSWERMEESLILVGELVAFTGSWMLKCSMTPT